MNKLLVAMLLALACVHCTGTTDEPEDTSDEAASEETTAKAEEVGTAKAALTVRKSGEGQKDF